MAKWKCMLLAPALTFPIRQHGQTLHNLRGNVNSIVWMARKFFGKKTRRTARLFCANMLIANGTFRYICHCAGTVFSAFIPDRQSDIRNAAFPDLRLILSACSRKSEKGARGRPPPRQPAPLGCGLPQRDWCLPVKADASRNRRSRIGKLCRENSAPCIASGCPG